MRPDPLQRSQRLPYRMRADAPTRYLLLTCGSALPVGSLFVIWQIIASFGTGNPVLGLLFTLVLLGAGYLLLSLGLQSIILFPDRMVITQWLFTTPRTFPLVALDRLEEVTVGPADLVYIYRKGQPQPLWLLDLFSSEDLIFAQEMIERREPPPPPDPQILGRAEGFRPGAQPPTTGPDDEPPRARG